MLDWLDEIDSPTDYLVWDYPGFVNRHVAHRAAAKTTHSVCRLDQTSPKKRIQMHGQIVD